MTDPLIADLLWEIRDERRKLSRTKDPEHRSFLLQIIKNLERKLYKLQIQNRK